MELADIKSRDDLRYYWQQVVNRPVWNAAEVEAERQALLPVAKTLALTDWERYLEAREGYAIESVTSAARLSDFVDWAREHRESVEDWLFASGLFSLGVMQEKLERTEDALTNYNELVGSFKQHSDRAIAITVATALFNANYHAGESNDPRAASQYLDELRQLTKSYDEPGIREQLAKALFNANYDARKSGDSGAASQHLDELRQLTKSHDEPGIREQLAKALCNAGIDTGDSGDLQAVSQILGELRQLTKSHDEPGIREQLAKALFNANYDAGESNDPRAASQYLDELRQLAKAHDEPAIREELAKALFNYSIDLGVSKDTSQAYDACGEAERLLQQLSGEDAKRLREKVAIRKNRLRNELGKPEEDLQEP